MKQLSKDHRKKRHAFPGAAGGRTIELLKLPVALKGRRRIAGGEPFLRTPGSKRQKRSPGGAMDQFRRPSRAPLLFL